MINKNRILFKSLFVCKSWAMLNGWRTTQQINHTKTTSSTTGKGFIETNLGNSNHLIVTYLVDQYRPNYKLAFCALPNLHAKKERFELDLLRVARNAFYRNLPWRFGKLKTGMIVYRERALS